MVLQIGPIRIRDKSGLLFTGSSGYLSKVWAMYGTEDDCPVDWDIELAGSNQLEEKMAALRGDRTNKCIDFGIGQVFFMLESRKALIALQPQQDRLKCYVFAVLRVLLSYTSAKKGCIPLHCSAVSIGDKGYVFIGPSGAGKSTVAGMLAPPAHALSDEFNIIVPTEAGYQVYSTPFTSANFFLDRSDTVSAPVTALFVLRKSHFCKVLKCKENHSILHFLSEASLLSTLSDASEKIVANFSALQNTMPIYDLAFNLDKNNLSSVLEEL